MGYEAPTTKEDELISLLTHCTELELQSVMDQLYKHCHKNNCLHIIEKSFGIDQELKEDLEDMTNEKDEWFDTCQSIKDELKNIINECEVSDSVSNKIQKIIDSI